MAPGTQVYLSWYDFSKGAEYVCKGEVVDNSLWDDTKWQGYVNVSFQPPHSAGAFCHHFHEDKLSLTPDNVPHDDCYLVCAKKSRAYEHDYTIRPVPAASADGKSPSDAWQRVLQFKQDHWDYAHGHLSIDALDEYYTMWHDAIAAKRGMAVHSGTPLVHPGTPPGTPPHSSVASAASTTPPPTITPAVSPAGHKPTRKQLRSCGSITFKDSVQTSFFD